MTFDLESSALVDSFVVASRTFAVDASWLHFASLFVAASFPVRAHETAAVTVNLMLVPDEQLENDSPVVIDDDEQHQHSDKFDHDNLIELLYG